MKTLFIITGASKGIGKGLAEKALQSDQNKVIGMSRSHTISHANYEPMNLDLSNIPNLTTHASELFQEAGNYEAVVLINNAGTLGEVDHMGKISNKSIAQLINLNVTAPMILMNEFIQQLKDYSGKKVIFNISSGAGKRAVDGWSGYCSSKAALDMATQVAYEENKLDNNHFEIRAIAPGVVDTEMQTQIRSTSKDSFSAIEKFKKLKEEGELSSEQEVAEKYFYILEKLDKYTDPILDVRKL